MTDPTEKGGADDRRGNDPHVHPHVAAGGADIVERGRNRVRTMGPQMGGPTDLQKLITDLVRYASQRRIGVLGAGTEQPVHGGLPTASDRRRFRGRPPPRGDGGEGMSEEPDVTVTVEVGGSLDGVVTFLNALKQLTEDGVIMHVAHGREYGSVVFRMTDLNALKQLTEDGVRMHVAHGREYGSVVFRMTDITLRPTETGGEDG